MALAVWQRTIADENGNIQAGASVRVQLESSGALASLYSDRAGTVGISNPMTADSEGFAQFYVAGGTYKITVTKGAFSRILRYVSIGTAGEHDQEYYNDRLDVLELAAPFRTTNAAGTNTITCEGTPNALTAYTQGQLISVTPLNTTTGAVTINVDELGALTAKQAGGAVFGTVNVLIGGREYLFRYDGTDLIQVNPIPGIVSIATSARITINSDNTQFGDGSTLYHNIAGKLSAGQIRIGGGVTAADGANWAVYGGSHATRPGDAVLREDNTDLLSWLAGSPGNFDFHDQDIDGLGQGSLGIGDDGSGNPRIYFDGLGGTDYIVYNTNTWYFAIANQSQYRMHSAAFDCFDDLRNNLGSSSIRFGEAWAAKVGITSTFYMEVDSGDGDPRITFDSGDYYLYNDASNYHAWYVGGSQRLAVAAARIDCLVPLRLKSYTVATLPAGSDGDTAYASDALKSGESSPSGTGCWALYTNSAWHSDPYNNVAASA